MKNFNSEEAQIHSHELDQDTGIFGPVESKPLFKVKKAKGSYLLGALVSSHEAWYFDLEVEPIK